MTASTSVAARAPRRVFLCDVAAAAAAAGDASEEVVDPPWEGADADRLIRAAGDMTRLMGIVVAVEGGPGGDRGGTTTLVIDDGTGRLVRVNSTPPSTASSRSSASPGDLVDCLVSHRRLMPRDDGTALTATLVASSVAVVSDPNAEVLRYLEICGSSSYSGPGSFHPNGNDDGDDGDRRPDRGRPDDTNNVFVPDSLRYSSAGGDGVVVGGDDVLRLIRAAASDGGVTERDLAVVLGLVRTPAGGRCGAERGDRTAAIGALRRTLDGLQAEGLVYRRRSSSVACGGGGWRSSGSATDGSDRDRGGEVYLPL